MATDPRAVLILDIDGTINPFYARYTLEDNPEKLPGFEEHSIQDEAFGSARAFLQTAVLRDTLLRLQSLGVELLWGSAWNGGSNLILRMLFPEAVGDWPTIIFPEEIDFATSIQSWKLATVREYVEAHYSETVPLIWLDDEIFGDAADWLSSRPASGLMLRPSKHRGVTEEHWNELIHFAENLGEEATEFLSSQYADGSYILRSL